MIRQTLAIFVDAYRDLNSRKLFWITLILSAIFVGALAVMGVDNKGLSIARWHIDLPRPQAEYVFKSIFRTAIVGLWLTWAATILALISTAGIFPDLITGGSIDLYLSKPISRVRLFLTKYFSGLVFVSLQVIVVTVGGYLVLGFRGHVWLTSLFWAIPVVICFFSYLFCICVLLGVLTRSTITALLLTMVLWALFAGMDMAEQSLLTTHEIFQKQADSLAPYASDPDSKRRAEAAQTMASRTGWMQHILYDVKTVTPKTSDTIDLLNRYVFTEEEMTSGLQQAGPRRRARPGSSDVDDQATIEGASQSIHEIRQRSAAWVVGTSLGFEAVIVSLATWIFCRRDY